MKQAFSFGELQRELSDSGKSYLEFLHSNSLSVGLYALPAGGTDTQQPHTEDEVYSVLSGRAVLRVGGTDYAVEPGSVIFVGAKVEHRFHTITEDLAVLVFFAPAEYSLAANE